MSDVRQKGRSRRRKTAPSVVQLLQGKHRQYLSAALCTAMILNSVGNPLITAWAAEDDNVQEFSFTSHDLAEAIGQAVADGQTLNKELEFEGEDAETYAELMPADGSLYKLKPVMDEENGSLELSVYLKLADEMELINDEQGAYDLTGEENLIFLLENDTENTLNGRIVVDDMASEMITVVPASDVSGTAELDDSVIKIEVETEEEQKEDTPIAEISLHHVQRVAATPSDAQGVEEKDTEADEKDVPTATDSDVEHELEGTVYQAVALDGDSVAAFVTGVEYLVEVLDKEQNTCQDDIEKSIDLGDMTVTASWNIESGIPAEAELRVEEVTDALKDTVVEGVMAGEVAEINPDENFINDVIAYDITLVDRDTVYSTWDEGTVQVTFSGKEIEEKSAEADTISIVHVDDEAGVMNQVDSKSVSETTVNAVTFAAEHFSVYALTFVRENQNLGKVYIAQAVLGEKAETDSATVEEYNLDKKIISIIDIANSIEPLTSTDKKELTFVKATIDAEGTNEIGSLKCSDDGKVQYEAGDVWNDFLGNETLYFWYAPVSYVGPQMGVNEIQNVINNGDVVIFESGTYNLQGEPLKIPSGKKMVFKTEDTVEIKYTGEDPNTGAIMLENESGLTLSDADLSINSSIHGIRMEHSTDLVMIKSKVTVSDCKHSGIYVTSRQDGNNAKDSIAVIESVFHANNNGWEGIRTETEDDTGTYKFLNNIDVLFQNSEVSLDNNGSKGYWNDFAMGAKSTFIIDGGHVSISDNKGDGYCDQINTSFIVTGGAEVEVCRNGCAGVKNPDVYVEDGSQLIANENNQTNLLLYGFQVTGKSTVIANGSITGDGIFSSRTKQKDYIGVDEEILLTHDILIDNSIVETNNNFGWGMLAGHVFHIGERVIPYCIPNGSFKIVNGSSVTANGNSQVGLSMAYAPVISNSKVVASNNIAGDSGKHEGLWFENYYGDTGIITNNSIVITDNNDIGLSVNKYVMIDNSTVSSQNNTIADIGYAGEDSAVKILENTVAVLNKGNYEALSKNPEQRTHVLGGSLQAVRSNMNGTYTLNGKKAEEELYSAPINDKGTKLTRFNLNKEINIEADQNYNTFIYYDPVDKTKYDYSFRYNLAGEDLNVEDSNNAYVWAPVSILHYDATEGRIQDYNTATPGNVALINTRGDGTLLGNAGNPNETGLRYGTDYTIYGNSMNLSEAVLPTAEREGYRFDGWYTAKDEVAALEYAKADNWAELYKLLDTRFTGESKVASDITDVATAQDEKTIYAKWTPATTYKVEYYYQNTSGHYDLYSTSDARNSFAGETVSVTGDDLLVKKTDHKYKLNTDKTTMKLVVEADGTSVLRVYFDMIPDEVKETFNIIINYYKLNTNTALADQYVSEAYESGAAYDVYDLVHKEISGYSWHSCSEEKLSGEINHNMVINVYYTKDSGGNGGTGGSGGSSGGPSGGTNPGGPGVVIPEAPVPMAQAPELEVIPEGETPLAALPKTGHHVPDNKLLFLCAGAFLAVYGIIGRRKKEEEE